MADTDTYQIQDTDREISSGVYHPYYPNQVITYTSQVEPLIDGVSFFNNLYTTIESLTGDVTKQGIYLLNWTFNKLFEIQPGILFTDYLKAKSAAGVDVRVLLWVNEYIIGKAESWNMPVDFGFDIPKYFLDKIEEGRDWILADQQYWNGLMGINLETLEELRMETTLAEKAQAMTLDYPAGSSHAKFVLVFDETHLYGFTGGMDFEVNRISDSIHFDDSNGWNNDNGWHDIQAKVSGHVTQELFSFYSKLWDELVYLKNNATSLQYSVPEFLYQGRTIIGTTPYANYIPQKEWEYSGTAQHLVQSLRTLPDKTRAFSFYTPADKFDFTFAPDGAYEIQLALKKAIANAEKYIYIEDQAMLSREILVYLKNAVVNYSGLKVILMTGQLDPDVPQDKRNYTIPHYFLELFDQNKMDQVMVFVHSRYVHSKLFLIDDKFALIGSAGLYNRAMFVEIEHSVSFVDVDPATESLKMFRQNLWGEHFRLQPTEMNQIAAIEESLSIWNPSWGPASASFKIPAWAQSSSELPGGIRSINGFDVPVSLVQYSIFKVDPSGTCLPGDAVIFTGVRDQNDPVHFINGGADFIEDAGLPDATVKNLSGKWILIVDGPNKNALLKIIAHAGTRITIQPVQPLAFDTTTTYRVCKPHLEKIEFAAAPQPAPAWLNKFINWEDCGELPL